MIPRSEESQSIIRKNTVNIALFFRLSFYFGINAWQNVDVFFAVDFSRNPLIVNNSTLKFNTFSMTQQ